MNQVVERELTPDERKFVIGQTQELWDIAKSRVFITKENKIETKRSYYSCVISFIKTVPEGVAIFHAHQELKNQRATEFLNYSKFVKGSSSNGIKTYKHILKFLGFFGSISKAHPPLERTKYAIPVFTHSDVLMFLRICTRGINDALKEIPANVMIIAYVVLATARRIEEIRRMKRHEVLDLIEGKKIFMKILKGQVRSEETQALKEYHLHSPTPEFIIPVRISSPYYLLIRNEPYFEAPASEDPEQVRYVAFQRIVHAIVNNMDELTFQAKITSQYSHVVNPVFHFIANKNPNIYKYGVHRGEPSKSFGVGMYMLKRYTLSKMQERAYSILKVQGEWEGGGTNEGVVRQTVQNLAGHQNWNTTQRYLLPSAAVNIRNMMTQEPQTAETTFNEILSTRSTLDQQREDVIFSQVDRETGTVATANIPSFFRTPETEALSSSQQPSTAPVPAVLGQLHYPPPHQAEDFYSRPLDRDLPSTVIVGPLQHPQQQPLPPISILTQSPNLRMEIPGENVDDPSAIAFSIENTKPIQVLLGGKIKTIYVSQNEIPSSSTERIEIPTPQVPEVEVPVLSPPAEYVEREESIQIIPRKGILERMREQRAAKLSYPLPEEDKVAQSLTEGERERQKKAIERRKRLNELAKLTERRAWVSPETWREIRTLEREEEAYQKDEKIRKHKLAREKKRLYETSRAITDDDQNLKTQLTIDQYGAYDEENEDDMFDHLERLQREERRLNDELEEIVEEIDYEIQGAQENYEKANEGRQYQQFSNTKEYQKLSTEGNRRIAQYEALKRSVQKEIDKLRTMLSQKKGKRLPGKEITSKSILKHGKDDSDLIVFPTIKEKQDIIPEDRIVISSKEVDLHSKRGVSDDRDSKRIKGHSDDDSIAVKTEKAVSTALNKFKNIIYQQQKQQQSHSGSQTDYTSEDEYDSDYTRALTTVPKRPNSDVDEDIEVEKTSKHLKGGLVKREVKTPIRISTRKPTTVKEDAPPSIVTPPTMSKAEERARFRPTLSHSKIGKTEKTETIIKVSVETSKVQEKTREKSTTRNQEKSPKVESFQSKEKVQKSEMATSSNMQIDTKKKTPTSKTSESVQVEQTLLAKTTSSVKSKSTTIPSIPTVVSTVQDLTVSGSSPQSSAVSSTTIPTAVSTVQDLTVSGSSPQSSAVSSTTIPKETEEIPPEQLVKEYYTQVNILKNRFWESIDNRHDYLRQIKELYTQLSRKLQSSMSNIEMPYDPVLELRNTYMLDTVTNLRMKMMLPQMAKLINEDPSLRLYPSLDQYLETNYWLLEYATKEKDMLGLKDDDMNIKLELLLRIKLYNNEMLRSLFNEKRRLSQYMIKF